MIVEKLGQGITIKHLSLETQKRPIGEGPFVPERDISDNVWRSITSYVKDAYQKEKWEKVTHAAADIKTLFPERMNELGIQLDKDFYKDRMTEDKPIKKLDDIPMTLTLRLLDLKKLFGDVDGFYGLSESNIHEILTKELDNNLQFIKKHRFGWMGYVGELYNAKIISPPFFSSISIHPEAWSGIMELMQNVKRTQRTSLATQAAFVRVVFPEKFHELHMDEYWPQMHDQLKKWEEGEIWPMYLTQAESMTILAAYDVRVTDNGLQVFMPQPKRFKEAATVLPVVRKF